jgi:predicted trehalose synthase
MTARVDLGRVARVPLPRNRRHLEDVAGVVRGFPFAAAVSESSSELDVAAAATEQQPPGRWVTAALRLGSRAEEPSIVPCAGGCF